VRKVLLLIPEVRVSQGVFLDLIIQLFV